MRCHVHGILLLDKPAAMTSNGALQRVKRLFQAKKAGHTGSLDPIATGMLPICFGEATKFSQFLLESCKSYHVTAKFGIQTTTGDREGEVVETKPVPHFDSAAIVNCFTQFKGEIAQIPPMFSAIKHQGKPLYELARRGIEVERKSRQVTIYDLQLEEVTADSFTFYVHCSKGTYIRTLVEDICRALGTLGHVTALRRLMVTPYGNAIMYTLPALQAIYEQAGLSSLLAALLPVETAVQTYPVMKLTPSAAFYLRMGQPVRINQQLPSQLVRLMSEDEKFLGIGEVMTDGRVKPHRLISPLSS